MVIISQYRMRRTYDQKLHIISNELSICPICGGNLSVIGTRSRMVIDSGGTTLSITIRRLRCEGCGKIHHELPDMIVPYKRHCFETIEKIIIGSTDGIICEERTIGRVKAWWTACALYFHGIVAILREKYGVYISLGAPKEIIRAAVNSSLWPHTRSACAPV